MKNQISLLRKESFGGTLINAISGKRIYLDQEEYSLVKKSGVLLKNLINELNIISGKVIIIEPAMLPIYNFSAPDTIFFEITRECNLTCKHCLNNSGKRLPQEFSNKQLNSIIRDICTAGVQEIRFTGGEPLMVSNIFEYISKIRGYGLRVSIGTNGTLIDNNIAQKLASVGLNSAIISVDGMEKHHDFIRGKGSFGKTMKGIKNLLDVDISVRINIVAMKSNIKEIPTVVDYFFQRNIPVMIRRFIQSGRAKNLKDKELTREDYLLLKNELQLFLLDEKQIINGHYLKDEKVITRIQIPFERYSCSAGHRGLVVLPNGDVQTCGFLGSLGEPPIGNLKTESLAFLWQKLLESKYIDSLRLLLSKHNTCKSCQETDCLAIALAK